VLHGTFEKKKEYGRYCDVVVSRSGKK